MQQRDEIKKNTKRIGLKLLQNCVNSVSTTIFCSKKSWIYFHSCNNDLQDSQAKKYITHELVFWNIYVLKKISKKSKVVKEKY